MSTQPLEILISSDSVCELVTITPETDSDDIVNTYDLRHLGSGVSRAVYALSDQHVLKIARPVAWCPSVHERANSAEIALWEDLSEAERDQGTFARIFAYADDHSWIIAENIPYLGEGSPNDDDVELLRRYGVGDQHGENYGQREDGSYACIDYGYYGGFRSADQPCYCGMCDCDRCYPDGCDCGTFEGCHEHSKRCEICEDAENARRRIVRRQMANDRSWAKCGIASRPHDGRNGRASHVLGILPSYVLARLERSAARLADGWADTRRQHVWSGDTSGDLIMVCRECADVLDEAERVADGIPDLEQGILMFPDRYVVGMVSRMQWMPKTGLTLCTFWFVRDRLLNDPEILNQGKATGDHKYGRIVTDQFIGTDHGFARARNICALLNQGHLTKRANLIARL